MGPDYRLSVVLPRYRCASTASAPPACLLDGIGHRFPVVLHQSCRGSLVPGRTSRV